MLFSFLFDYLRKVLYNGLNNLIERGNNGRNLLLIEIISTLFVAKLVEQKMLKQTEINDAFEALVDYQNELYGADYELILNEEDCQLNLKSYLDSIRITSNLINKLLQQTTEKENAAFLNQIKRNFADELRFIRKSLEKGLDKDR